MYKAGSNREVSPVKHSIGFLTVATTSSAATDVVYVVSGRLDRVYDQQARRIKEALLVTACLSAQKARIETDGMPGTGWQVVVEAKTCGCRISAKTGAVSTWAMAFQCGTGWTSSAVHALCIAAATKPAANEASGRAPTGLQVSVAQSS